jgi:hypothetical protein
LFTFGLIPFFKNTHHGAQKQTGICGDLDFTAHANAFKALVLAFALAYEKRRAIGQPN